MIHDKEITKPGQNSIYNVHCPHFYDPVPGRPTIWITVGQGPIALAVGAGGGGMDIFTLIYPFSSYSLSLGDGPI